MAEKTIDLNEYLRNVGAEGDRDFLRETAEMVLQLLMDAELSEQIGAVLLRLVGGLRALMAWRAQTVGPLREHCPSVRAMLIRQGMAAPYP